MTAPMFAGHGWLAAVLPARSTRFRVADADLAYTLRHAGAELVDDDPEVEIAPLELLEGRAPVAIVPIDAASRTASTRARQAAGRIAANAMSRRRALAVRAVLRRRGYREVVAFPWDRDQPMPVPGLAAPHARTFAERLPRRMLIVARREAPAPTALAGALAEAARQVGRPLQPSWPLLRAGGLVVLLDSGVLRVALGPGSGQIVAQTAALAALAAAAPPPGVAERVPALLAHGRSGLAHWSLEQRLPGRAAPHEADGSLLAECVDFAVALHGIRGGDAARTAKAQAETAAAALPSEAAQALAALADQLDRTLAGVPRGFGHGDFCTSNLVVAGGRLAGVVDWEGAEAAALPLLDVLHLELLAVTRASVYEWGHAVTGHLLPAADRPAAGLAASYLHRLGLRLSPGEMKALAVADGIDRVIGELRS
jgi:hypothetical protein